MRAAGLYSLFKRSDRTTPRCLRSLLMRRHERQADRLNVARTLAPSHEAQAGAYSSSISAGSTRRQVIILAGPLTCQSGRHVCGPDMQSCPDGRTLNYQVMRACHCVGRQSKVDLKIMLAHRTPPSAPYQPYTSVMIERVSPTFSRKG